MDASQSALDSLRTVEFRETLKGYHRDDVDEYLEKAAVEAEGLQEQLRQGSERLRQAAERISQLEETVENQLPPPPPEPPVADETLQRTLLLAQKFVDQTKADSEAEASRLVSDAEAKARVVTDEAETRANQIVAQSEGRIREEISRLEDKRARLTNEVELMSRHLENERARLRQALTDILKWVDANVHPDTTAEAGQPRLSGTGSSGPGSPPPLPPSAPAGGTPPVGAGVSGTSTPSGDASASTSDAQSPVKHVESDGSAGGRPGGAVRTPGNSAVLPI